MKEKSYRLWGDAPYKLVLVHGGPGAAGEMQPVAQKISDSIGVLEPFQTAVTLSGQVLELRKQILQAGAWPVILAGYSWGAWLSFITAARYPELVKKLILISSGPFLPQYAAQIEEVRLSRMTQEEKEIYKKSLSVLMDEKSEKKDTALYQLGALCSKIDSFDPVEKSILPQLDSGSGDLFGKVMEEALLLRNNGALLKMGKMIRCRVSVIHGKEDPHPADGVIKPVSGILKDFHDTVLPNCGHTPWNEKQAAEEFYRCIKEEVNK